MSTILNQRNNAIFCLALLVPGLKGCMEVNNRKAVSSVQKGYDGRIALYDSSCQTIALGQDGLFLNTNQGSGAPESDALREQFLRQLQSDKNGVQLQVVENTYEVLPNSSGQGASLTEGPESEVVRLNYTIEGVPVCMKEVLVHKLGNEFNVHGNKFHLTEAQMTEAARQATQEDWTQASAFESAKKGCEALIEEDLISSCPQKFDIYEESRCFAVHIGKDSKKESPEVQLRPFLKLSFETPEGLYFVVANNNEVYQSIDENGKLFNMVEKRSFTAANSSGIGTIFQMVPSSKGYQFTEKSVPLTDLGDSGYLCSPRFITDTAYSPEKNFAFTGFYPGPGEPIMDFRKYEVTMFYNATVHSDWIRSLTLSGGWTGEYKGWLGPQIRLYVMSDSAGVNNKAEYKPRFGETGGPAILLGNGDNKSLRNLLVDPEVISHELGHHVVFRNLKSTTGQSLDMHEGLADAFVFLRTKNPCLAESICPSERTCISTQCLRNGDNSYVYKADTDPATGAETYNTGSENVKKMKSGHLKSQLISGFMWDISKAIGYERTASLLLRSVSFMVENGDYSNLMSALKDADRSLFQGSYFCPVIKKAAEKRYLQEFLPPGNC